ncbi:hypothetical protein DASC09_022630 [Saccharomycopsis crataegensis]|uniref:Uncharacterized protein n=1 Tax=Saccharomycopsis crataegensis TaxID=43959 RepID=A0AAV5QJB7_9ASCO|nr:hypothetical protein DASC09_022630 [Saccharomycopsis crataegensis]
MSSKQFDAQSFSTAMSSPVESHFSVSPEKGDPDDPQNIDNLSLFNINSAIETGAVPSKTAGLSSIIRGAVADKQKFVSSTAASIASSENLDSLTINNCPLNNNPRLTAGGTIENTNHAAQKLDRFGGSGIYGDWPSRPLSRCSTNSGISVTAAKDGVEGKPLKRHHHNNNNNNNNNNINNNTQSIHKLSLSPISPQSQAGLLPSYKFGDPESISSRLNSTTKSSSHQTPIDRTNDEGVGITSDTDTDNPMVYDDDVDDDNAADYELMSGIGNENRMLSDHPAIIFTGQDEEKDQEDDTNSMIGVKSVATPPQVFLDTIGTLSDDESTTSDIESNNNNDVKKQPSVSVAATAANSPQSSHTHNHFTTTNNNNKILNINESSVRKLRINGSPLTKNDLAFNNTNSSDTSSLTNNHGNPATFSSLIHKHRNKNGNNNNTLSRVNSFNNKSNTNISNLSQSSSQNQYSQNIISSTNNHFSNKLSSNLPNEPPITLSEKINLLRPKSHTHKLNPQQFFKRNALTSSMYALNTLATSSNREDLLTHSHNNSLSNISMIMTPSRDHQNIIVDDNELKKPTQNHQSPHNAASVTGSPLKVSRVSLDENEYDHFVQSAASLGSTSGLGIAANPTTSPSFVQQQQQPAPPVFNNSNPTFNRLIHMTSLSTVGGISDFEDDESVLSSYR